MLSITDFVTHVKKEGLQRSNRFQLIISIPDKVMSQLGDLVTEINKSPSGYPDDGNKSSSSDVARTLSLMAADVNTPGYNVSSVEMHVGTTRKIAYDKSTGDFNVTFRCSGNMTEKKLFDAWIKFMFRPDHAVSFYEDYVSPKIKVMTLDYEGNVTYECAVSEAYPSVITELNLNTEQSDAILDFQVTFNYRKLYNVDEDYGQKKRSFPPIFGGTVEIPDPQNNISASGLPQAPLGGNEFPPISLPPAPPTDNKALFLIDIYKNIERVKQQMERGTLNKEMGARLITNIIRDMNAAGVDTGISGKVLEYANDVIYAIGRFK